MHLKKYFLLIILSLYFQQVFSQAISQAASCREINAEAYIRLQYENDYFTASDIYYTQGISLEFVHPSLKLNPINNLLLRPHHYKIKYGLAIEHNGYTPSSIRHNEILNSDHPYAACLLLKSFVIASSPQKKLRLVSSFSTGVIGHMANGDWMQKSIHKWTNNKQPLGWENQVKNDIILNYEIIAEKRLISYRNSVLMNLVGEIAAGTLNDQAGTGLVFMLGKFEENYFYGTGYGAPENKEHRHMTTFHLFCQPMARFIGYNATLQGGMFNRNSPYVLESSQVERIVLENTVGLTLRVGNWWAAYFQTMQTKEFKAGLAHRWGGIRLGFSF